MIAATRFIHRIYIPAHTGGDLRLLTKWSELITVKVETAKVYFSIIHQEYNHEKCRQNSRVTFLDVFS